MNFVPHPPSLVAGIGLALLAGAAVVPDQDAKQAVTDWKAITEVKITGLRASSARLSLSLHDLQVEIEKLVADGKKEGRAWAHDAEYIALKAEGELLKRRIAPLLGELHLLVGSLGRAE